MRLLNSRLDLAYPFKHDLTHITFGLAASLPEASQKPGNVGEAYSQGTNCIPFDSVLPTDSWHAFGTDFGSP